VEREADAQTSDGPTPDGDALVVGLVLGGTLAIVAATLGWAHHIGSGGETILAGLGALLEGAVALGGVLLHSGGAVLAVVRAPLLLAALVWQLIQLRRGETDPVGRRLLGAFVLAGVAHSYLLDGQLGVGFASLAVALVSLVVARGDTLASTADLGVGRTTVAFLLTIALYSILCSFRLDVFPAVYADETAYHEAARMHLGQIERGGSPFWDWKGYTFERFQAQLVPLWLQSAALAGLGPGLLSIRLASFAILAAAFVLGALLVRRRLGDRVACWMLALACVSPMGVSYGRTGFYLAASILHSVATLAAVARFVERGDRRSAGWLGALLGGALYFYQISWFVPLLAGFAVVACAFGRPRSTRWLAPRPLFVTGLAAAFVLAPAPFVFREGLADIAGQTFDHRSTLRSGHAELLRPRVVVRARQEVGMRGFAEIQARLAAHRAKARVVVHEGGVTTLRISGPRDRLDLALAELPGGPWRVLSDTVGSFTAPNYVVRMFARLFYSPGPELGAWIPVPLLNPLVAPLVLLGFASAWRRRAEPLVRVIVVWVVGGALIPAAVAGDAARRAVLILPFVYALAAFPLVELSVWCRSAGVLRRRAGAACAVLFMLVVAATSGYQYFSPIHARWDGAAEPGVHPSILELVKVIKAAPESVPILLRTSRPGLLGHLEGIEGWPSARARDRILLRRGVRRRSALVRESCAQAKPFVWISEDSEEQRALFTGLGARFETRSEPHGPYWLVHVDAAKPGGCPGPD
jgi:hypothetical protein